MNTRDAREGERVVWRPRRGRGFIERTGRVRFVANARRLCLELADGELVYADARNVVTVEDRDRGRA